MMTEGQIRVAIEVLRAYIAGDLKMDSALRRELEQAIEQAADAGILGEIDGDDGPVRSA